MYPIHPVIAKTILRKNDMIFVKKCIVTLLSAGGASDDFYHQGWQLNSSATAVEQPNTL